MSARLGTFAGAAAEEGVAIFLLLSVVVPALFTLLLLGLSAAFGFLFLILFSMEISSLELALSIKLLVRLVWTGNGTALVVAFKITDVISIVLSLKRSSLVIWVEMVVVFVPRLMIFLASEGDPTLPP